MNNGTRRALTGSIHKIREFELEKVRFIFKLNMFLYVIYELNEYESMTIFNTSNILFRYVWLKNSIFYK